MPIVLAIEPDRRQAAHLTAIVQHRVGAELILADTTEGALDAIGNRVPDLVLVPALLSPTDDAALAAALRVIAAAAHVRTLTIPALSSGVKHSAPGGMLAKWRKKSASPEPDGCDPAVFGEQISAYLAESAAQRAEFEESLEFAEPQAPSRSYAAFEPPPMVEPMAPVRAFAPPPPSWHLEDFAPSQPVAIREEAVYHEPEPIIAATEALAPLAGEPIAAEPAAAAPFDAWAAGAQHTHERTGENENEDEDEGPLIDLSDELEELSEDEVGDELFDGEQVGVYMISADEEEPAASAFDLLPDILEPPATPDAPEAETPLALDDAAPEPIEMPGPLASEPYTPAPMAAAYAASDSYFEAPEPEPPRADIEPWVPMYLTPGRIWPALEGVPAETPVARTEQPDWIELVASLRQDLERRRTDPATPVPDPIAARPSDGAKAEVHQLVKKQKPPVMKTKPVQDEWGFFDPEQCGFSTLLAKLEEITDEEART